MIAFPIIALALALTPAHSGAGMGAAQPAPASSGTATPSPAATSPSSEPAAVPSAIPLTSPSAVTSPPPSAPPAPVASQTPSPYKYRFVPRRPANLAVGQPVIFAIYLNSQRLHSEGPIEIKVETNDAVTKVLSRSNGHEGGIPRVGAGEFVAAGKMPKLPVIAHGMTVDLEFIATSADGRKTSVRVPIKLD